MNKKAWIALIVAVATLLMIIGACSIGAAVNKNSPNNDNSDDTGKKPPVSSDAELEIVLDITTIYF